MQNIVNAVKGTALGVAEYLTPVLKVIVVMPSINIDSKTVNSTGYLILITFLVDDRRIL